jgi:phosphoribosylformimino-5-aminoimidazole carboxamide ribotide isomerase
MIIIPAIDIIDGKVVRLHQGDFSREKSYSDDPLKTALMWQEKGASFLHVVDLDGARYGTVKNREVITNIVKNVKMKCEIGGGLREEEDIEYFLRQGAYRAVLGTKAVEDLSFLEKMINRFGDKVAVGIDFSGDRVLKKGWLEKTDWTPEEAAEKMREIGVKTLIVTDISTDGTLEGPNFKKLKEILERVDMSIIASGGISCIEDIRALKKIENKRLEGVIIGRALYEGKLDLGEAIRVAESLSS